MPVRFTISQDRELSYRVCRRHETRCWGQKRRISVTDHLAYPANPRFLHQTPPSRPRHRLPSAHHRHRAGPHCQPHSPAPQNQPPLNRRLHHQGTNPVLDQASEEERRVEKPSRHGDDAAGAERCAPDAGGSGAGGGPGARVLRQRRPEAHGQAAAQRPVGRRRGWCGGGHRRRLAGAPQAPRPGGRAPEVGVGRRGCERGGIRGDAVL